MIILKYLLDQIDSKYKYSSILDYKKDKLFNILLVNSNDMLLNYIEDYPHLINTALIVKNNIKVPNDIKGKVHLISEYITQQLST